MASVLLIYSIIIAFLLYVLQDYCELVSDGCFDFTKREKLYKMMTLEKISPKKKI